MLVHTYVLLSDCHIVFAASQFTICSNGCFLHVVDITRLALASLFFHNLHRNKRTVLSTIARLLDPLAWINLIIFTDKIFLKHLWCAGLDWDQCLLQNLILEWQSLLPDIQDLHRICVPRCIHSQLYKLCFKINLS